MPTPNKKLAESLDVLKALQEGGRRVFRSDEFTRVHRERLVENGFLQDVMKGWLISSSPGAREGDSTPWYASFWEFCARYRSLLPASLTTLFPILFRDSQPLDSWCHVLRAAAQARRTFTPLLPTIEFA